MTAAPAGPLITIGSSVWPLLSTSVGAEIARDATGGLLPGEMIGWLPAETRTSLAPFMFPGIGLNGEPVCCPNAASPWTTTPSSPNGSPSRVAVPP